MLWLEAAGVSDIGGFRTTNQDSGFTAPWGAAVADGVGGGPSGDIASAALVHRLVAGIHGPVSSTELLSGIRAANWDLRAHIERDSTLAGMATTFTGMFATSDGEIVIAHAGDSRAYRLCAGAMSRQTRDDSFVQVLVDHGLVSEEDAARHPHRNVITASLHGSDDDTIAIGAVPAAAGDRWLLCSDGVTDYLPEGDVAALLAAGEPAEASAAIVRTALEAGSRDNVTALVCDLVSAAPDGSAEFYGAAADRFNEQLPSPA